MKKRIGILTWCDNNGPTNFGQILQCYSIQSVCEALGYKTVVIQYRKKDKRDFYKGKFSINYLNWIYEFLYKIFIVEGRLDKRIYLFRKFIRNYIHLSPPCYDKQDVEKTTNNCNYLICGSDQIWNPVCFDPIYYLDFGKKNQKKISYAPSGVFKDERLNCYLRVGRLIDKLDAVSVRENVSIPILEQYTTNKITCVLDPVLLLNYKHLDKITGPCLIHEPYLFCYVLGSLYPYELIIKNVMERYHVKKVICIPSNIVNHKSKWIDYINDIGPAEFLSLIKYAKVVCTDSFHGIAVSIQYNKQFYSLKRKQPHGSEWVNIERINNIFNQLDMKNRYLTCVKDLENIKEIDYNKVKRLLGQAKCDSFEFLKRSLE